MTEAQPEQEYQAGRTAALEGRARADNPHDGRTNRARAWNAGYDSVDEPAAPAFQAEVEPAPEPDPPPPAATIHSEEDVPRAKPDIYVAKETFAVEVDGAPVTIHKGITRVRAGHPLLKGREELFDPIDLSVHYDVEQATAAPGERRGA